VPEKCRITSANAEISASVLFLPLQCIARLLPFAPSPLDAWAWAGPSVQPLRTDRSSFFSDIWQRLLLAAKLHEAYNSLQVQLPDLQDAGQSLLTARNMQERSFGSPQETDEKG
jgi:hypothetical protein